MYNVWEIADWFKKWGEYKNDEITQLRMMKFLFYAQAQYIRYNATPLFEDAEIVAWKYGPAVKEVYAVYKNNNDKYPLQTNFDWNNYSEDDARFLVKVWNTYHHLDDGELIEYSHNETVWKNLYNKEKANTIGIPDLIKEYA